MLEALEIGEGTLLAGRYRVIERIGAGGMSTVYLAEDQVLGREVAVKRMRSESPQAEIGRFRREARLGATLSHPNLVTIFDAVAGEEGEAGDGVLIVMEYVDGETLADVLARDRLEPQRALEVLRGVAAALDHAHSQGIVHRDVKPANVLLGADGAVKLADLGIATAAEATRITSVNDVVGTLAYISPERLEAQSPGGPPADVYSLAVLAHEVFGGRQLNRGSTPAEVLHRTISEPPPDLRDAWPAAPASLAGALRRAMDPDPANRPAGAGELVDEIERALREREPAGTATRPMPRPPRAVLSQRPADAPRPAAASRDRRPRAALIAMLALGLVGTAALGSALLGGGGRGEDEGAGGDEARAAKAAEERVAGASEEAGGAVTTAPAPSGETAAGDGAALNDQGYALIQAGRYEEAIPVLQRAVESFPEGTGDLTYAYALFNLGNALRLAGRPDEAVPVLERRLEIPNQTETVQRELDLARAEAGYEPAGKKPKKPKPPKPEE